MRENYDTGYGKYDSRITAYIAEHVLGISMEDEMACNSDLGEGVARVGRRLVWWDSQGFYASVRFKSPMVAEAVFYSEAGKYEDEGEE
jgi:hypothetical protein